ncbi:MAG: DUF2155 domain-containing protein, partial [Alphaproteobacteria bacterium]|nr:DUF2155 domain-containing protein [Alphaproteobacteria bacterium]
MNFLRGLGLAAIVSITGSIAASAVLAADLVGDGVLLQGLDKVTARISEIHAPNGTPVRFGILEITTHKCLKRP